MDTGRFKEVLGQFATGITVVAGIDLGEPVGFTCQSFMSLSIDPPFIAVAPARTSTSWPRIARSNYFSVSVLGSEQEDLARRFAVSGDGKFEHVDWRGAPTSGSPIIDGSIAWIECAVELVHPAGDHELILGRVLNLESREGAPLIFFRRRIGTLEPPAA